MKPLPSIRRNQTYFDFNPARKAAESILHLIEVQEYRAAAAAKRVAKRVAKRAAKRAAKVEAKVEPTPAAPVLSEPTFAPAVIAFWQSVAGPVTPIAAEVESGPAGIAGQAVFTL